MLAALSLTEMEAMARARLIPTGGDSIAEDDEALLA